MSLHWATTIFIFCHGVLFLHHGIAVLVIEKKTRIHYIVAALLGDFGAGPGARRSPGTYRLIASLAARIRYERSRLGSVSVDERIAAMTRIMREEELYRDPALTLEELAQRLGVNPHQLSELLNSLMGATFRAYLNGLRIERAKSFLLEDGASTILDIAFESGFNSKSAFNAAFRNETGQTPSEYRKCR